MLALTARAQSRYETCGCPYRECTDDAHFVATEDAAAELGVKPSRFYDF